MPLPLIKRSRIDNGSLTAGGMLAGIEMKVGGAVIPMGIAGPVTVHGEYAKGDYYIPLATNEAALVAGVQRGIKAINLAGGMKALVTFDGMARAPMIEAPDIEAILIPFGGGGLACGIACAVRALRRDVKIAPCASSTCSSARDSARDANARA